MKYLKLFEEYKNEDIRGYTILCEDNETFCEAQRIGGNAGYKWSSDPIGHIQPTNKPTILFLEDEDMSFSFLFDFDPEHFGSDKSSYYYEGDYLIYDAIPNDPAPEFGPTQEKYLRCDLESLRMNLDANKMGLL